LLVGVVLLWSLPAGLARADELFFLGPDGTGTERRGLVVVSGPEGACVPLDEASVESLDEGVEATLLDSAGPCSRWMRVVADSPRDHLSIRLRHPNGTASGAIAMGSERGLEVEARIRGRRLEVRVQGAPEGEDVRVVAVDSEGETVLERDGERFTGPRPARGSVGIVARSASLTGADALSVGEVGGPSALIVPSAFQIPLGGAPRIAAFLVVTDEQGRLSQNVPLRIVSERGSLRRLDWLAPGLAAVSLSTGGDDADTVDLSVSDHQRLLARADLPVAGGAPVRGELDLPSEVRALEPFDVRATIHTVDDTALPPSHVRVLCPDGTSVPVDDDSVGRCPGAPPSLSTVSVQVIHDGRRVPLVTESIRVLPAPRPEAPAVVEAPAVIVPPTPAATPSRVVMAFLRGGVDLWGNGGAGAGVGVAWPISELFQIGVEARYEARGLRSSGPQVALNLGGTRHELAAGAHLALAPAFGDFRWVNRLTLQGSMVRDRYELGGERGQSVAFVPSASLATGVAFGRGGRSIEVTAGATGRFAQPESSWREAPLTFFLELRGGLAR